MPDRPIIFIASSSEQLRTTQRIHDALKFRDWDVRVWDTQFAFSAAYVESLEKALDRADFAVVVMTGDDATIVRKDAVLQPRDNVIFELGLFIGRLGRERCAFFHDASAGTRLASDLEGVKGADFYPDAQADGKSKRSLDERVREVKMQIRRVLRESGPRYKPDATTRSLQQSRWHFLKQIEGQWWERMRTGDDDASALSLVTVALDAASNSARLDGKAYGLQDTWLATWRASAELELELELNPPIATLRYWWGGSYEGKSGAGIAGHGFVRFDKPMVPRRSDGPFYGSYFDTRLAEIKDGLAPTREKRCSFVRLDDEDRERMQDPLSAVALERVALVRKRLEWG